MCEWYMCVCDKCTVCVCGVCGLIYTQYVCVVCVHSACVVYVYIMCALCVCGICVFNVCTVCVSVCVSLCMCLHGDIYLYMGALTEARGRGCQVSYILLALCLITLTQYVLLNLELAVRQQTPVIYALLLCMLGLQVCATMQGFSYE